MVYAAWMRQATEGNFLFDNRFAVEQQPGLTFHAYFLILGWIAKLVGIPWATTLARVAFSALFVWLAYRMVRKVTDDPYTQKLALALTVIGGGLGFLCWHVFGVAFVKPSPLSGLVGGRLPVDVWQTEGFVFPSMLVNGLFVASLCLIVTIFLCVLSARGSWRRVPLGALAFAALMNIHSYDILMVTFVLAAFLVVSIVQRRASVAWVIRVAVMGLGAVPPALWFVHVLRNDPVFQARAATPTYAPNFQVVLVGYLLLISLAVFGIWRLPSPDRKRQVGLALFAGLAILGYALATSHAEGYWMGMAGWIGSMVAAVLVCALLSTTEDGPNLVTCWGVVGLVAPYFPALFQRKLAMGLAVPWAILAGLGFAAIVVGRERGVRNLVVAFGLALLGGSSIQWFFRDLGFARSNVSNTTLHAVYLTPDMKAILQALGNDQGRRIVLAMPGIANPTGPDSFGSPYLPDLNPVASGLTGAYSYAGHWSETPDYGRRRTDATMFFLRATDEQRKAFVDEHHIDYIIAPVPESFPEILQINQGRPLADVTGLGEVLVDGSKFRLIKVSPSSSGS